MAGEGGVLRLEDVHSGYGPLEVVRGVSLVVGSGEVVAVIGPNGAGKSTLLRTIFGLVPARQGRIWLDGEDLTGLRPVQVLRRGVAYVMQGYNVLPNLTVDDNLQLGAYIRRDPQVRADIRKVYELFPPLWTRRRQKARTLSGGERRMLELARVLLQRPRVLLLDEPTLGLAPRVIDQVYDVIAQIHRQGVAVLLVEQNARTALRHAHRAYVLETGRIRFEGRGQELLDHPEVRRAYLGGELSTNPSARSRSTSSGDRSAGSP
jgi:branched-chain amino acid transport system ATP-binding protein